MKKPILPLAILSIIGAGSLVYWQYSAKPAPTAPEHSTVTSKPTRATRTTAQESTLISRITDTSIRWEIRVDMLRRLDASSLTSKEIDTLYTLLNHIPKTGFEENWWVVVNEIMEQMRKQAIGPERYTGAMLAIIRDANAPEVLRDYAVQHLGQWVTPRGADIGYPSEQDSQLVKETVQTLGDIVSDSTLAHTSIPGTTLAVLADMKAGALSEAALTSVIEDLQPWFTRTISGNNSVSKVTRISAINAISMLDLQQHAPVIRQLAESDQTDPSIRLNSIAALGSIGQQEDLPILKTIANSETRYRHAAKAAINKLQAAK